MSIATLQICLMLFMVIQRLLPIRALSHAEVTMEVILYPNAIYNIKTDPQLLCHPCNLNAVILEW